MLVGAERPRPTRPLPRGRRRRRFAVAEGWVARRCAWPGAAWMLLGPVALAPGPPTRRPRPALRRRPRLPRHPRRPRRPPSSHLHRRRRRRAPRPGTEPAVRPACGPTTVMRLSVAAQAGRASAPARASRWSYLVADDALGGGGLGTPSPAAARSGRGRAADPRGPASGRPPRTSSSGSTRPRSSSSGRRSARGRAGRDRGAPG